MKIAVIGTGYVGLVSGTCFAETGNEVVCVDIDAEKVEKMRNGIVPIYEPGLETLFHRNISQGRLSFTTNIEECIDEAKIVFLALPTPTGNEGAADLTAVLKVAEHLSKIVKDYKIIVDKSTVPVGTAEKVHDILAQNLSEDLFDVVSNPEFLREGMAIDDFLKPDRVILGTNSERARELMRELYKPYVNDGNPIIFMDERSAELTKYAANSFLATKITFMNEVANLCELVGANVDMVRLGIGSDKRIGNKFLNAGVGYGGSCFPKDVRAFVRTAEENEYDFKILNSIMDVNENQKTILAKKIINHFGDVSGKTIAIWGLAFKPNTDDIREAPALHIIKLLIEAGANIRAFDPEAMDNVKAKLGDAIEFGKDRYEVLKGADALAIVTEWNEFKRADLNYMKEIMNQPLVFDGRNIMDLETIRREGYTYYCIGRPEITSSSDS